MADDRWMRFDEANLQHASLLATVELLVEDCRGSDPLMALHRAAKAAARLHCPELFGGVVACLACSPGMPPPILIEWSRCETVKVIGEGLGVPDGR